MAWRFRRREAETSLRVSSAEATSEGHRETLERFDRMWLVRFVNLRALLLTASATAAIGAAADAAIPTVAVPVLPSAPAVDGRIGPAWANAATLTLPTDFTNRRAADEPTTVRVGQDDGALDVAFDVTQREALVASTVTNGSSVTSDDYVEVALSPDGPQGFQYAFYANPRGARYQTSSENSAYAPPWSAAVALHPGGYTVTLRIPLAIIRSGGRTDWRAQFLRATVGANALDVWTIDPRATSAGDATFFGRMTGIGAHQRPAAARPKARAQLYGLGEITGPAEGGDTSRIGADIALPVASTTSVLASIHPDYSNVETDQQTIAPTAFARSYNEVRPFFTQAAQPFNYTFSCSNCPQLLYTPAIPTYRDAYALEGTAGPLTYAAFDVVGIGRNDSAEAIDYGHFNEERALAFDAQSVTVNEDGGIHDQVTSFSSGYLNLRSHVGVYLNGAQESGTTITDSAAATYSQGGFIYTTATANAVLSWNQLGDQFAPLDAFVSQNDVRGPEFYGSTTVPFKAHTILHDLQIQTYEADYINHLGQPAQNDLFGQISADFRDLVTIRGFLSESAVRTFANEFLPFDGSGVFVGYKAATATPDYVQYAGGAYYHGELDAWNYIATLPVARNTHLALELDRNSYQTRYPGETGGTQWLERASLDLQFNRETQFDLGVRRLIGPDLPNSYAPPVASSLNAGNVSVALHHLARNGHSEVYAVYGDPNSLATTPALFIKYIRYIGASKGT